MDTQQNAASRSISARLAVAKYALRARLGLTQPAEVRVYRGYENGRVAFVTGRVLERRGIPDTKADDSRWLNLRRAVSWLESDEVPYAHVRVEYAGCSVQAVANDEGYFTIEAQALGSDQNGWAEARASLVAVPSLGARLPREGGFASPPGERRRTEADAGELREQELAGSPPRFSGEIALIGRGADFGLISDIDDTLLVTDVTSKWRMLGLTLFGNALTRQPPPGTRGLYRALSSLDGSDSVDRPCFYVSKSPWNLYDMLTEYMQAQGLPKGPLLLRDLALPAAPWQPKFDHKTASIRKLLADFPAMRFVLIGDSGERDPAIFVQLMREHPGRFLAAYVRRARGKARHLERAMAAHREAVTAGLPLVIAEHAEDIIQDAKGRGLVTDAALASFMELREPGVERLG